MEIASMPMSLLEAKTLCPLRALSVLERQQRRRHPQILDPRISDLMCFAASLIRENEHLRDVARRYGAKVTATTSLRCEVHPEPWQASGHPEDLLTDFVTKPKKPKAKIKNSQRFGHETDAAS
jgi:hypothetical protein